MTRTFKVVLDEAELADDQKPITVDDIKEALSLAAYENCIVGVFEITEAE
jgi:hypothetical protein